MKRTPSTVGEPAMKRTRFGDLVFLGAAPKPAYATISALGNLYCVNFYRQTKPDGLCSSTHLEGYSEDTFRDARGTGIPLVDYRTMNFDGWTFPTIAETCSHCFGGEWPLQRWLDEVTRRGATVSRL